MTQNLQNDPEAQKDIDARHPWGGMGDPDEVAKAVLFLASDDVGWVHGAYCKPLFSSHFQIHVLTTVSADLGVNLPVDGGYMIM